MTTPDAAHAALEHPAAPDCCGGHFAPMTPDHPAEDARESRDALIAALAEEPKAMTLSHDRLILQRAERDGGQVVVVRCPHTVGLAFETDHPDVGVMLGVLPCPCNDRSEVVAHVVPAEDFEGCDCTELCSMGPTCPGGMLARLPGSGCSRTEDAREAGGGVRPVDRVAKALAETPLIAEGGAPGGDLGHSWRCQHPDTYGPCSCVEEVARAQVEAIRPVVAELIAAAEQRGAEEVQHWKAHAEEAGAGFARVCRDYARVSGRNVRLLNRVETLADAIEGEGVTHNDGCEGEPDCLACIVADLRALVGTAGEEEA